MPKKKKMGLTEVTTYRKMGKPEWFAEIAGKPGTKVTGKTQVEAVGRLVMAKHRHLRLFIKRDETRDM